MDLIEISHLYKTYKTSGKNNDVLKDVSLTLPETGLVVIFGKSGCGKSTLLNLIGGIDRPSKGYIRVSFHKCKYSIKKISFASPNIIANRISFIFQHYHLLENETLIYNVILPGLIQGINKLQLEEEAKDLLKRFGFEEDTWKKEAKLLSGGEKARIAILRALITNPRIILADEPTGALDEQNALKTMKILKKASQKRLVVLVTHNRKMAEAFADRIISLSDGKVVADENKQNKQAEIYRTKEEKPVQNEWIDHFVFNNFKRRFKRNCISIIGLSFSLIFSYLLIGFVNNSSFAIEEVSTKHLDYGTGVINKEIRNSLSESKISLVKTVRPSLEEVDDIETKYPNFLIMNNYDCYFNNSTLYADNNELSNITYSYVYDFSEPYIDPSLIMKNNENTLSKWNDVFVNKKAYELFESYSCSKPIFKLFYENRISVKNDNDIIDLLDIEDRLNIIGVVDEFDFLSTPKVYFNYSKIEDYFSSTILDNASLYKEEEITWKSLVDNAEENSELSSYSYRCFLLNYENKGDVVDLRDYLTNEITLDNPSLDIADALKSLTYAATIGLEIFLVICLSGSALILGVFSFSAYNDDKKTSSILSCLGAKNSDIILIFVAESSICSLFSFAISTIISCFISNPINQLIEKFINIPNLINVPMLAFMGKKFLLPIIFFSAILLVGVLFTVTPIIISKKISVRKELAEL